MKAQEQSEMRVIADAIACAPARALILLDRCLMDTHTPDAVRAGIEVLRTQILSFSGVPAARLVLAADSLLAFEDRSLEPAVGAALYSALCDYGHCIERYLLEDQVTKTPGRNAARFRQVARDAFLHMQRTNDLPQQRKAARFKEVARLWEKLDLIALEGMPSELTWEGVADALRKAAERIENAPPVDKFL